MAGSGLAQTKDIEETLWKEMFVLLPTLAGEASLYPGQGLIQRFIAGNSV